MKGICMLLVPAFAALTLLIESIYDVANPVLHHYIKSEAYGYWNLLLRNESLIHPRNSHSIEISIGDPVQNFSLILDTLSPYASVCKNDCQNCHCTSTNFNQYGSLTFNETSSKKSVSYFLGEATGSQGFDTLRINSIDLSSMPFILADSDTFDSIPSGVLGLGYDEYGNSFISLLKDQKVIDIKSFSLSLRNPFVLDSETPETLLIRNTSQDYYLWDSEFEYIKLINSNGDWEIPCDSTEFEGISYGHAQTAKIDLGLSLLVGPKPIVLKILEALLNNHNCRYNDYIACNCSLSYPSLILDLDGHKLSIDSSHYLYKSDGYCYPLLDYSDINFWILGDVFIQAHYLDFNMDKKSIGFPASKIIISGYLKNKTDSGSDDGWSSEQIGGTIGGIFALLVIGAMVWCCVRDKELKMNLCAILGCATAPVGNG